MIVKMKQYYWKNNVDLTTSIENINNEIKSELLQVI